MFFINYLGFICLFPFVYCFVLYPIVLVVLGQLFSTKNKNEKIVFLQKFSFILPAYNEEKHIVQKLRNLSELSGNLPLEILIGDDGSTDQTPILIKQFKMSHPNLELKVINQEKNLGKWAMLKRLVQESTGDILVISDISGLLPKNILNKASEALMNDEIAVYSPSYHFSPEAKKKLWEKCYWPYERLLKHLEDHFYSTCGAHGACYFIRKSYMSPLADLEVAGAPPINDDFLIPTMAAIIHQKKIHYDWHSPVWENDSVPTSPVEYKRRLRIAQGNFSMGSLLWKKRKEMHPKLFFVVFSHKILRSYIAPGLIVGSLLLSFYDLAWALLMILSILISPMRASLHALMLNLSGKKEVGWA